MTAYRKRQEKGRRSPEAVAGLLECEDALARGELDRGSRCLGRVVPDLPLGTMDPAQATILQEGGRRLADEGAEHLEYLILTLHALLVGR